MTRLSYPVILLAIFNLAAPVDSAENAPVQEPRAVDVSVAEGNVTLDYEEQSQRTAIDDTDQTQDTTTLSPSVGAGLDGSIYHPNFLFFETTFQLGRDFEEIDTLNNGVRVTEDNEFELQRYDTTLNLLQKKPYSTSLFASRDELRYDYDFFTRTTIDSTRLGFETGYRTGLWPLIVSFIDSNEDTEEETVMDRHESTLTLGADNRRETPESSSLDYSLTQFEYEQDEEVAQDGVRNNLSFTDTQRLATANPAELRSSLYFNNVDSLEPLSRTFSWDEQYRIEHSERLDSQYGYEFSDLTAGESETRTHDATASLTHQLYQSLQSIFDLEGQRVESSGGDAGLDTSKMGGGISETYTKKLPAMSQLTLGLSGRFTDESQTSTGGDLMVIGERHTLGGTELVLLDQPVADVASITVTDANDARHYVEGLDYRVTAHGSGVEIARLVGGSIPDGSVVLVDYLAASQPTQDFTTITDDYNFRLDLFNNFLSIHGRSARTESSGAESLTLEDIDQQTIGITARQDWWEVGTEHLDYTSTVSDYRQLSSFQRLNVSPSSSTMLSLNLDQSRITYRDADEEQKSESYIGRVESQLGPDLHVNAEAGLRNERGVGYNFDSEAYRAGVDYQFGKFLFKLTYEDTHYTYTDELRDEQRLYLRARRSF